MDFVNKFLVLLFCPCLAFSTAAKKQESKSESAIKAANLQVAEVEKLISEGSTKLPKLKAEYDFLDATEGVPPSFIFYFEAKAGSQKGSILRACKVHVGREVYSNDYIYYFDSQGKALKYLFLDSGISGEKSAPERKEAIIYAKAGEILWRSNDKISPPLPFDQISKLFASLDENLKKF